MMDMLKLISLNVNGLRAALRKNLEEWLKEEEADIFCVQEIKAGFKELMPYTSLAGMKGYFHPAQKAGYSGVAIYSRYEPLHIHEGFGMHECDREGRYIQLDFDKFSVASVYLPSGSSSPERQQVKFSCLEAFFPHIQRLKESGKNIILCGDWNIAHQNIDLKNWRNNQKNSGFLPEERAWLTEVFKALGFVDIWRHWDQETPGYTWWSQRGRAYDNDVGWRIDYHIANAYFAERIQRMRVVRQPRFSDHAALIGEYYLKE
jgi:exodeoxyribonuclease-3